MQNQEQIKSGMNKTGTLMSPIDATRTADGAVKFTRLTQGDATAIAENRIRYKMEADPVGTIPLPTSLRGAASAFFRSYRQTTVCGNCIH